MDNDIPQNPHEVQEMQERQGLLTQPAPEVAPVVFPSKPVLRPSILLLMLWASSIFFAIVALCISYPESIFRMAMEADRIPLLPPVIMRVLQLRFVWYVLPVFSSLLLWLVRKRQAPSSGFQLMIWIGICALWLVGAFISPAAFLYADAFFLIKYEIALRFVNILKLYLVAVAVLIGRILWKRMSKTEYISRS